MLDVDATNARIIDEVLAEFGIIEAMPVFAAYADPVAWIESEFYVPELNGPLRLEPYQRAVIREACRRHANGKFVYDLVLWSDIKKSIKSTIAAAIALHRALNTPWGSIKIVANDLKQADSRVFFYIRRAIELNPRLRERATIKLYKIELDNHTTIEAVPVDPKGEAGGNDDFIEFTELHAAGSKASIRMWSEMTIPPTKHGYGQRWVDTYAGYSGEAPILEPLYEQLVKPENQIRLPDTPDDLEVYAYGTMLCLWNTRPRCPWQTPAYYASEEALLPPNEFARIHRNQWGSSEEVFVPGEWWDACQVASLPPMDRYRELVIALDAGVSGDCFGMVGAGRDGDKVPLRFSFKWTPPRGGKLQFSNPANPNDEAYPEGMLRRLIRDYNVIVVYYDPYQLHDFCTRLAEENLAYFKEFNQGAPRLVADKQFYDLIRERRIQHTGDPDLTEHIKNANRKSDGEDGKLRIVKRTENKKIDLAVCSSMASAGALEYLSA